MSVLIKFDCLELEVTDAVMQMVSYLFANDVPELQHIGKLCPVLFISSDWIVGSYNEFARYVKFVNIIVINVMKAVDRLTLMISVYLNPLSHGRISF